LNLAQKTLLITGGTGSFGHAVARRFLDSDLSEIRVFSRDEKKQEDMRHLFRSPRLRFYIGDVRDADSIDEAMRGVDLVFCAAALKQVPSCEFHPMEAVKTNVVGTDNTLKAAVRQHVEAVVVLSTDKAVYPVNAMGMSKALMEKAAIARSRHLMSDPTTRICVTRYGNVMGTRGSVIPLFLQQAMRGDPITVTDPAMTRFMMSIDEAVDLVLFAFEHGTGSDTFVQKAPAATIGQLAEAINNLFGRQSEVRIIGTRHGEKKHESLLNREERIRAEDLGNYFRIPSDDRDLNYALYFEQGEPSLSNYEDFTSATTRQLSDAELGELLLQQPIIQQALATGTEP
jgi:UDP-glucose 4-epimerase